MSDVIKHIIHGHKDKADQRIAYCGRRMHPWEWHFTSVDHAVCSGLSHDRLLACKKCVGVIRKGLEHGHEG